MKHWLIAVCILAAAGVGFLIPGMKGYYYITAVLWFAGALIAAFHLCGDMAKRIIFILTALGMIYFLAVEIPILENHRTDTDAERPYLVVLGAGVRGTTPTLSLIHRMTAAEEYLKQYSEAKAVLSGGKGPGEDISEAACMKSWLLERGIAEERLLTEDQSSSTAENLRNSARLIKEDGGTLDRVAILSSPYHLYRAKMIAGQNGYENPAGVAGVHGYPVYSLGMYIREAFGLTHFWVFGD